MGKDKLIPSLSIYLPIMSNPCWGPRHSQIWWWWWSWWRRKHN